MAGDRGSVSLNSDSKRRTQYFEEQFQYKDNAVGGARERVQREAPVIAELRTNVIVSPGLQLRGEYLGLNADFGTFRSRMSSRW